MHVLRTRVIVFIQNAIDSFIIQDAIDGILRSGYAASPPFCVSAFEIFYFTALF
jgi:hypothetical protein